MTGRAVLPIVTAALFATAGISPTVAQVLGPNEPHGSSANVQPSMALTASQRSAIYGAVLRQRLRSASAADIPLIVGALVPRSAPLLALPDEAVGDEYALTLGLELGRVRDLRPGVRYSVGSTRAVIPAHATVACMCRPLREDSIRGSFQLATRGLRQLTGRIDATVYLTEWNDAARHVAYSLNQRLDAIK